MDDQFFIPKHDRGLLRDVLASLPALCDDLAIAVTRQARVGRSSGKRSKGARPPAPIDLDVAEAIDELHAVLVGWVRLVCEHRGLSWEQTLPAARWLSLTHIPGEFVGPLQPGRSPLPQYRQPSTAALARWLHRHLVALAMTPGSEMALREIQDAKKACVRVVCPPPEELPVADPVLLAQARASALNPHGIAMLARELGEEYRHLTEKRVNHLRRAGHITPLPGPWRAGHPLLYRVGAVLDAHLAVPIRQRHAHESERVSA